MHTKLITVGRLKPGALLNLAQEYQKRITSKLQIIEVETKETHLTSAQRQEKEMRLICAHLEDSDCLLVLDMQGDNVTSEQLAQTLNKYQQTYKKITFVIGGADGLHPEILKKAHMIISFGKCTWPHLMIRVMLLEQIYRAQQILANHPYHH